MLCIGFLLFFVAAPRYAATLSCFTCSNVDSLENCNTTTKCGNDQSCFTKFLTNGQNITFTMGCTDNRNCGPIPEYGSMSGNVEKCYECCGTDKCNNDLCNHKEPPPCIDNEKNCASWNERFNICLNIHEAKLVCRQFCNLCSLVDGKWADWSHWSSCDVTCGYGKHTRVRTCTNPAPAYQGLDCRGNSTDTKPCIRPLCPVHGGWTEWSEWGTCPVTCGIGIQKRHRTCTNPSPLRYGDHCFGDAMDVTICKQGLCDASETTVAFNAYQVTDCSPSANQRMVFSKVLINQGSSYNNISGFFVAPRNGTYTFRAQLCITTGKSMHFDIMVGGTSYSSTYAYAYGGCECPAVEATVQLKTSETVSVNWGKTWSYSIYNVICQNDVYLKNYFSGNLISA